MKKIFVMFAIASILASCGGKKQQEETVAPEPPKQEVYQPKHQTETIDLKTAKKYDYRNAPTASPATSVVVKYDPKTPYAQPIEVTYTYENGDTFTYVIPAEFGLWKNQSGKFRVISDDACTVWLQGQTKKGKFHEFVLPGDPKYNGVKIKPNSYRNLPSGEIKYRK